MAFALLYLILMSRKIKKSIRFESNNFDAITRLANSCFSGDFSEALNWIVTEHRTKSKFAILLTENSKLLEEHMLFEALKKEQKK